MHVSILSNKAESFREGVDLAKLSKELVETFNIISPTTHPRRMCCGKESQQDENCRMTNSVSHLPIVCVSTKSIKLEDYI